MRFRVYSLKRSFEGRTNLNHDLSAVRQSLKGAHLLLQTRAKVLNNELEDVFRKWYPPFRVQEKTAALTPTLCCTPNSQNQLARSCRSSNCKG